MNSLVEIQGFNELQQKIKLLSDDRSKKREVIALLRRVASTTVRTAKQNAPVSTNPHVARNKKINPGNLKKSIGIIVGKKGEAKDNPILYVGPRAKGANDGWYGHFVEYGHNVYARGFKRKNRKKGADNSSHAKSRTKAVPFMQRTYEQTGGKASQEAAVKIAAYIQKRIDKLSSNV